MDEVITSAMRTAELARSHWPCIISPPQLFMHRENTVFKVETTVGPAALRIHRIGYHDRNAIKSEMLWMAHLARSGLNIPAPILNSDKSYIAEIPLDGQTRIVDLLTWLTGDPLGKSDAPLAFGAAELRMIFYNLGSEIAKLHIATDAWSIPANFKRHAWDREGFLGKRPFWGTFWNVTGLTQVHRVILRQARAMASSQLDALRANGADYGLIHADFVRQNILVSGTDIRIIDFDDSGWGFRMFDLATALVKNRDEPDYAELKQALFAGYRMKRTLTERDESTLDLFLALRDFAHLGWADARRTEPGMAARLPAIRSAALDAAKAYLAAPIQI